MIVLLLIPNITKRVLLQFEDEQQALDKALLTEWLNELNNNISVIEEPSKKTENFKFNPNKVSTEDLERLGFTKKTAQRIDKYRSAGGSFKSEKDILKIYGISEERVKALSDFIVIPKKKKPKPNTFEKKKQPFKKRPFKKTKFNFELNSTSVDSLVKIRGIGPFYAKNIIQLRDKLGGFVSLDQLNQVYKINNDIIQAIDENTTLNVELIKQININSDSIKSLFKHPYISYKLAKTIFAYKNQHGTYKSIDELKNIKLVSDSLFLRLKPYLGIGIN